MRTVALLKKESAKAAVIPGSKATSNPLQRKAAEEEDDAFQMKRNPLQLQTGLEEEEEEPVQMKQNPLQQVGDGEEELLQKKKKPLQLKKSNQSVLQLKQPANNPLQLLEGETAASQPKKNDTGLPDNLKAGVETLSGYSMDDVRVHYNSNEPAQLQALAYAQGTDIHVAPGQEKHLAHEAWHVVQQKQGRVQPTMQMKQGIAINDDQGLENEADVMGSKALIGTNTSSEINVLETAHSHEKELVQAKSYHTVAEKNKLKLAGVVDVVAGAHEITCEGTLKDVGGKESEAAGSVSMKEYQTPADRASKPVPDSKRGNFKKYFNPSDALRVHNLTAEPRRIKLGQLLTYSHGLEAKKRGIPYVIAMNVTDARGPFYEPLGFMDYNSSRPWRMLKEKHDSIHAFLASPESKGIPEEEYMDMVREKASLLEEMAESSMIINTDSLLHNSFEQFKDVWNE